jgi:ferredoxin/flavodoxin
MTGRSVVLYFSGTGNTEYAARGFANALGIPPDDVIDITHDGGRGDAAIASAQTLIVAYPNYMCCIPKVMQDYLTSRLKSFEGKRVFTLITYANFFFDGDMLVFRLLRKNGIRFTAAGSLAIQMPMNVCDMKLMAPTPDYEIAQRRELADERLVSRAAALQSGETIFDGSDSKRLIAFLRQRMFYRQRIERFYNDVRINANCIGCGACVACCPLRNLELKEGRAVQKGRCTQCYRCANLCPSCAITLMGQQIQWRYRGLEKGVVAVD